MSTPSSNRPYWIIYKPPYIAADKSIISEHVPKQNLLDRIESESSSSEDEMERKERKERRKREKMLTKQLGKYYRKHFECTDVANSRQTRLFEQQIEIYNKEHEKGSIKLLRKCKKAMLVPKEIEQKQEELPQNNKSGSDSDSMSSSDDELDDRWKMCVTETMKIMDKNDTK